MRKAIKILLIAVGLFILGISILVLSFIHAMKPDEEIEKKTRKAAEQYIEKKFTSGDFEIYDILYDNMGNFSHFEYAAKVRDKKTHVDFLVYYNDETEQMEDDYLVNTWADQLEAELYPFMKEHFMDTVDLWVFYDDEVLVDLDPNRPGSYKDQGFVPYIQIEIPRRKSDEDNRLISEFEDFIKSKGVPHATIIVKYIDEKEIVLEEEGWQKEF